MNYVYYGLFITFRTLIRIMPSLIIKFFLEFLAFIAFHCDKKHRKIIQTNLNIAFNDTLSSEEKKLIAYKTYRNMSYYLADFVNNQGISSEELLKKVTLVNFDPIKKLYDNKEKIIFITAHYGNWELIALPISYHLNGITAVGRDLESPLMQNILRQNREQFGLELVSKKGAMKHLIRSLSHHKPIALLVDQNTADNEGILIDFFGKKARHTPTASILSRKFDAWIVPAFIRSTDYKHYTLTFLSPFKTPVTDNESHDIFISVQQQAHITQDAIVQKPDEWFWSHRRWKNQYEHLYA